MTSLREQLALWIERRLPRPRLRHGATGAPRGPVERIIVFGRMPNPTYDYYFAARLEAPGMPPFQAVDIRHGNLADLNPQGAFIIICRYASPDVLTWLDINADRLSGVGLFLDDDIPAVVTGSDADFPYRLFLYFRALWPLYRLNRNLDIVWASTPHLASTMQLPEVQVLPPAPPERLWKRRNEQSPSKKPTSGQVLIAYHATGVHLEEHRFLRPVIEEVLAQRPQARFEVFADGRAASIWAGLERVSIRKPLPWADYLADADHRKVDIMLVPLHPSRVNDSRAPTKLIDIVRYQAAGVFSEGVTYGYATIDTACQRRLPYVGDIWRNAIIALIDDRKTREEAKARIGRLVQDKTLGANEGLMMLATNKSAPPMC